MLCGYFQSSYLCLSYPLSYMKENSWFQRKQNIMWITVLNIQITTTAGKFSITC